MRIVVFNAGSSSLKFGVFDHQGAATVQVFKGAFERFRDGGCQARFEAGTRRESGAAPYPDLAAATAAVPGVLADWGLDGLDAVGHRIAHGGADFAQPALLDDAHQPADEDMNPERLLAVWSGADTDPYATASVTGTLAVTLRTMGRAASTEEAEAMARELWNARDRAFLKPR